MAKYVASQTNIEIISWKGTCEVHEQFNDEEINEIRKSNPGIKIIAHPECPPDVIKASDFAGSTAGCPHMKKITLPKILNCLENETNEIILDPETINKARKSVERMAEIGR